MESHESAQQCVRSPLFQRFSVWSPIVDLSENVAPLNTAATKHNIY
jgi:hypothetical protein